jgi:hypothetical protein
VWTGAWPPLEIDQLDNSLKLVEALVRSPERDRPDEVTAALARFLVVRTCGYLEQVIEVCCRSLIISKSAPVIASFGGSWLGRGTNPAPEKLAALAGRFSSAWADELDELLNKDDQRLRREIALLVDRRNKIAHGLSEGIGSRKALDLLDPAREVADWFILRLDPRR